MSRYWSDSASLFKTEIVPQRRDPRVAGALALYKTYKDYAPVLGKRVREGYNSLINMARTRSGRSYRGNNYMRRNVRQRVTPRVARGVQSGLGVTVQHDARSIYRKKTMPRYRKKRWKRFKRKINAVSEKDLGSRTVVFNKSQAFTNSTSGNHGLAYCALYSAGGVGDSFMSDMVNMSGYENVDGNPTHAAGADIQKSTKFLFQSGVLDVTFRNTSYKNVGGVATLASEAKLEVDVYELISSNTWSSTAATRSDITACLSYGAGSTDNLGGGGLGIGYQARGSTPWDFPTALSYYRLKILKKTKYFVNNSDVFTYQVRDPKRHVINQERMEQLEGGNLPRWTRHVLIVFKLVPGLTIGTGEGEYTESLTMGMTRKYLYKIEGVNENRDRYLTNT